MVSASKILTVSYGTFSCTLEGFDDSFEMMKAIAEYFRDLASDDRYFGAEPPKLDAEMLARIAERDTARKVAASRDERGGIVLRPQPEQMPIASEAAKIAAVAAAPVAAVDPVAFDEAPSIEELEAALPKIQFDDEGQPDDSVNAAVDAVEDVDIEALQVVSPVAEPVKPSSLRLRKAEVEAPEAAKKPAPVDAGVSFADRLQRIRAVVAKTEVEETSAYIEDEHAEDFAQAPELSAGDMLAAELEANGFEAPQIAQFDDADDEDQADYAASSDVEIDLDLDEEPTLAEVYETDEEPADYFAAEADVAVEEEPEVAEEPEPVVEPEPALRRGRRPMPPVAARVMKVRRADFEKAVASGLIEEVEDEVDQTPAPVVDQTPALSAQPTSTLSDEEEEDLLRELAAISAQKRAAAEVSDTAPEEADFDEYEVADEPEESFDDAASYDDDNEEDYKDDRAALPEDEPKVSQPFKLRDIARKTLGLASEGRELLAQRRAGDEDSMNRLMQKADSELAQPDGRERRSAIAHLRAAVAATKAEGDENRRGSGEAENSYRSDLANVVRPRRPASGERRVERPSAAPESAPLKLIASQRVDTTAAPVSPRRISSAALQEQNQAELEAAESFAEFAQEVGAVDLPDLLEAAAAYMAFVEGQEEFSRPQIMTRVRMVEGEDFSRENGLRVFGQLLRDGKIERRSGGRFGVSDNIGFRPDDEREAS